MGIKDKLQVMRYRIGRKLFRWVQDDEGDLGVTLFGVVTLIKYKGSTIIKWWARYEDAPKYIYSNKSVYG